MFSTEASTLSDFIGFVCDLCGQVWTLDKRTRATMKFDQNEYCDLPSYRMDVCPHCIAAPPNMIPVSKRAKRVKEDPDATQPGR